LLFEFVSVNSELLIASLLVFSIELNVDGKQLLGLFRDMMRKMLNSIEKTKSEAIKSSLLTETNSNNKKLSEFRPLAPLTDELNDVAKEQKERQKEALLSSDLSQYKVKGSSEVWNSALSKTKGNLDLISVKTGEKRLATSSQSEDVTDSAKKPKKHKMKKNKKKMDRP
jgi:hypothetical protein